MVVELGQKTSGSVTFDRAAIQEFPQSHHL